MASKQLPSIDGTTILHAGQFDRSVDLPRQLTECPLRVREGEMCMVYGQPASMKTWSAFGTGIGLLAMQPRAKVVVFEAEGAMVGAVARLQRLAAGIGVDVREFGERLVVAHGGFDLSREDRRDEFRELMVTVSPDLAIVDPLAGYFRADENSATDVGRLLADIREIAAPRSALVLLHHSRKSGKGTAIDMRGSSAIRGWADRVTRVAHKNGVVRLTEEKARDEAVRDPIDLRFEITESVARAHFDSAQSALADRVLVQLKSGPATATRLKQALSRSGSDVKKGLRELLEAGLIRQDGNQYVLPEP